MLRSHGSTALFSPLGSLTGSPYMGGHTRCHRASTADSMPPRLAWGLAGSRLGLAGLGGLQLCQHIMRVSMSHNSHLAGIKVITPLPLRTSFLRVCFTGVWSPTCVGTGKAKTSKQTLTNNQASKQTNKQTNSIHPNKLPNKLLYVFCLMVLSEAQFSSFCSVR